MRRGISAAIASWLEESGGLRLFTREGMLHSWRDGLARCTNTCIASNFDAESNFDTTHVRFLVAANFRHVPVTLVDAYGVTGLN